MKALIVGHGSVGKRHLLNLRKITHSITVIDPNSDSLTGLNSDITCFSSLEEFERTLEKDSQSKEELEAVGVVTNWGPDHFETTLRLISLGFKKILVEKPLASNMGQLEGYNKILDEGVKIWCNFHLRFGRGFQAIDNFQKSHGVDSPIAISVTGGAKCLSTTGIHWIDLAVNLFKEAPSQIYGNISNSQINPRNASLSFFDGINFFRFSKNRTLSLHFSNASQSDAIITIMWERHMAEIRSGKIRFYGSDIDGSENLPTTRSIAFSQLIAEEDFFECGFDRLFAEFLEARDSQSHILVANRALLLALCSDKLNKTVAWDENLPESLKNYDWKIS